jgi:hypothetical protein
MFKPYIVAAAFCAAVLSCAPALAGEQDFTLVNATGYTVSQVYVSPSTANDWEEDILGKDVLADGDRTNIHFDRDTSTCKWDLKVVYDDGDTAEWSAVNLCKISVVTIHYNADTDRTWATYE